MVTEDEQYLRNLGRPEDVWVLSGQQWWTAADVARMLGISDEAVRSLAERGAIPGAILHDIKRVGWRLPRDGLITYLATQRRKVEERRQGSIG